MTDIVERLKDVPEILRWYGDLGDGRVVSAGILEEAAAEIERLRARLAKWEPMAFAGTGTTFEPHIRCSKQLAALGKPYPRTCLVCRLGPCRDEIVPHTARAAQMDGEG